MSNEESIKFQLLTENEITSFRPMTEMQGTSDWFAMRQFAAGDATVTMIVGEVLSRLDQDNYSCELEDLIGIWGKRR